MMSPSSGNAYGASGSKKALKATPALGKER
jgi:hypothetical protein